MVKILRAASGQQTAVEDGSGPTSYPSGGYSMRSKLGRVDSAHAEIDSGEYQAHVESINDNNALVIQVYSQGGSEVGGGTDLSDETVRTDSSRL